MRHGCVPAVERHPSRGPRRHGPRKGRNGEFESESEVSAEGLRYLQDERDDIELWLREEVVPVVDAMRADPSRGIPIDKIQTEIDERCRKASKNES